MKKLFVVLALGSLVACNSGSSTETKVDSITEAQKDDMILVCGSVFVVAEVDAEQLKW